MRECRPTAIGDTLLSFSRLDMSSVLPFAAAFFLGEPCEVRDAPTRRLAIPSH
jgi:hypothetical protein